MALIPPVYNNVIGVLGAGVVSVTTDVNAVDLATMPNPNSNSFAILKNVTLCNTTASPVKVNVTFTHKVDANTNIPVKVISDYEIAANDTLKVPVTDHIIYDKLIISASAANAINYYITGSYVTQVTPFTSMA